METGFTDQEYRDMDRGALVMWLGKIQKRRAGGCLPEFLAADWISASNALHRLGGLMGAW